MIGVRFTSERREQLAALLDHDGAALEAGYPQVAEYMRTAARLPATSDPDADAALDLRVLHYMTGGESTNPYWDIVAPATTPIDAGRRAVDGGNPRGSARLGLAQTLLHAAYAYAVPSPETLQWIAAITADRPVVEIGAGRGYWAHQLALHGVDVTAYDRHPPGGHTSNTWFPAMPGLPHQWHPVGGLRDLATMRRSARQATPVVAQHVLFLCWPPAWEHPMARNALAAYERIGGDQIVYIGEHGGGRCADEHFFNALDTGWELASEDTAYVKWWNLNDVAQLWVRKTGVSQEHAYGVSP